MRYVIETAGNIEYIITVVKIVKEIKAPRTILWKEFNYRVGHGNKSVRFAEPHFSFAKELALITDNFQACTEAGKALLVTFEKTLKKPIFILLYQFLKNDAPFLLPYLKYCDDSGVLLNGKQINEQIEMAKKAYKDLWEYYGLRGAIFTPTLRKELKERTLKHHVLARNRFLVSKEGLNLNQFQIRRLIEKFIKFAYSDLPDDTFYRLGEVITDRRPNDIKEDLLQALIKEAYSDIKAYKLASAKSVFLYINQLLLPNNAVQFSIYKKHLIDHQFRIEPAFDRDDFLFAPREENK
ncbi:MAG: hypothetical protein QXQ64_02475 [Candidatus Bathyarchaeia archaeon]